MNELYNAIYSEHGRLRPGFVLILAGTILATVGQIVVLVREVMEGS